MTMEEYGGHVDGGENRMMGGDYDDDFGDGVGSEGSASLRSGSPYPPGTSQSSQKKVRKNHNEFEKRRREAQRLRLEELRVAVPGLDSKASMVTVLTAARAYIDELKGRLGANGLSSAVRTSSAPANRRLQPHHPLEQQASFPYAQPLPTLVSRKMSDLPEQQDGPFRKGRAELLDALPPVCAGVEPHSSVFTHGLATLAPAPPSPISYKSFQSVAEQSSRPTSPPQILVNPATYPNQARPSLILTSAIQDSFSLGLRRDSGLLLPTGIPDTFYYGRRDSSEALHPVPLPMILEKSNKAYVACAKCRRGVDGLVMIDCDCCKRWHHIRCIGIDPSSIPVRWSCPECPSPSPQL